MPNVKKMKLIVVVKRIKRKIKIEKKDEILISSSSDHASLKI